MYGNSNVVISITSQIRRSTRKRGAVLSSSSLELPPTSTLSNVIKRPRASKSSGLDMTDTENKVVGNVDENVQLTQRLEMELTRLEAEKEVCRGYIEEIQKELRDVGLKISATNQKIDELTAAREHKASFSDIFFSLFSGVVRSSMEDFAAKEKHLNADLAGYKRAYTSLQHELETRLAERISLITRIATLNLNSDRVATAASSSTQHVYSDKKTMVCAPWQYNLSRTCVLMIDPKLFSRFICRFISYHRCGIKIVTKSYLFLR